MLARLRHAASWIGCALALTCCAHAPLRPARPHPLDPLSASEHHRSFDAVRARFAADPSLPQQDLRFPLVALAEPAKASVLAWRDGQPIERLAEVHVAHAASARTWVARVDLVHAKVIDLRELPKGTQPALSSSEYTAAGALVRAYAPWQAALRARGLDPALAYVDLWAPGHGSVPPEAAAALSQGAQTRLLRALTFQRGAAVASMKDHAPHNPYLRPVEGLVVTVDLNAMKVVHMSDTGTRTPVSSDGGNAERIDALHAQHLGKVQSDIQLDGQRVRWHGFQFVIGFHPREGLVLYDVRYDDHGTLRPIAYRLSLSEIYVPYGLADPAWSWRSAFDVGEYNAGSLAQPLDLDGDVPSHAQLLDVQVASDVGPHADNVEGSRRVPGAIALYERDAGVLWTRTDPTTGVRDTRVARELVVTWSCWLGNYIYGFDWVFKLDGSIEVRASLNGTTLNRGTTDVMEASAPKIAKDARGVLVAAPHHQHFLSFRLDLDVDGPDNELMEMALTPLPGTPSKNAFDTTMLHMRTEGARDVAPSYARHWHVESGHNKNTLGRPTSYALEPGEFAVPYSAADFPGLLRGGFATHQLWFTRYREEELYAAGAFPYQATQPDGVTSYIKPPEPLSGQDDLVLWYTAGFTHVARPEDHPVMPSESVGFRLVPRGFFDRNPALEVEDLRHQAKPQ
jgi:primary-amine oxidase